MNSVFLYNDAKLFLAILWSPENKNLLSITQLRINWDMSAFKVIVQDTAQNLSVKQLETMNNSANFKPSLF